jgi:hypothetical protein
MKTIILTFLILSHIVNAQWVQVSNGMGNLTINALVMNGNNLFAGAMSNGVYLSTNNGSNWSQTSLNADTVFSLTAIGNYVFAGTSSRGVFLTTNNGANWTQTSLNNLRVWSLAAGNNYILAGTGNLNGIFRSSNNGTNWIRTINNRTFLCFAINGNDIFAGTYVPYGIYKSTNSGLNWSLTTFNNHLALSLAVKGNYVFVGTNTGVYLSTNYGISWQTQPSLNSEPVYALLANGNNIFAGIRQPYCFYISYDNGSNWVQKSVGLNNLQVNTLCILNNYIFAGTAEGGVYRRLLSELVGVQWSSPDKLDT